MPGFVDEVYAHSAVGGKFLAILKCNKTSALDDGRARQAALVAFGIYSQLKNVILVDSDVDIFGIPGVSGHVLDPSQQPAYNPFLPARSCARPVRTSFRRLCPLG